MRRTAVAAFVALLAACSASSSTSPPTSAGAPVVHVIDASVRRLAGGAAVLSFAAHNAGDATDTLTDAACACASAADVRGDAAIGPEETGLFTAEGPHVSFRGFEADPGDVVDVTLTFANAGDQVVTAEVAGRQGT